MLQQSVVAAERLSDTHGKGAHLNNLGLVCRYLGKFAQAITFYEQALVISEDIGNVMGVAAQYVNLGLAYKELGEVGRVRPLWEKAQGIFARIGSPHAAIVETWLTKLDGG